MKPEQSKPFEGSVEAYRYGVPISDSAKANNCCRVVVPVAIVCDPLYNGLGSCLTFNVSGGFTVSVLVVVGVVSCLCSSQQMTTNRQGITAYFLKSTFIIPCIYL